MLDDIKTKLKDTETKLSNLKLYLNVDKNEARLKELETQLASPGFWDDQEKSKPVIQELKLVRAILDPYFEARKEFDEIGELAVILDEEDRASIKEVLESLDKLSKALDDLEFKSLLNGDSDINNAIVSIHSGAGGTESCDWASMLLRMYSMWAEKKGYKIEMIDMLQGEEAGLAERAPGSGRTLPGARAAEAGAEGQAAEARHSCNG